MFDWRNVALIAGTCEEVRSAGGPVELLWDRDGDSPTRQSVFAEISMLRTGWRWSANQDALVLDYKDGQPGSS